MTGIRPYRYRASFAFDALAFVVILLSAATVFAQSPAGTITALTGSAHLQRGAAISPASQGMAVQTGDRLTTDASSSLTVTLTDGSRLVMNESSALVIDEHVTGPGGARLRTRVNLFSGLVRSIVNLTAGGLPNFEVHTPNAVAAARATDYETAYREGETRPGFTGCNRFTDVAVMKGTVGIAQAANPTAEVTVPEGYETSVPCGLAPLSPGPLGMTGASTSVGGTSARSAAVPAVAAPPPSCPVCIPPR